MENSVGTFRTGRLMQGDRPSQVTVNTGSTVIIIIIIIIIVMIVTIIIIVV